MCACATTSLAPLIIILLFSLFGFARLRSITLHLLFIEAQIEVLTLDWRFCLSSVGGGSKRATSNKQQANKKQLSRKHYLSIVEHLQNNISPKRYSSCSYYYYYY
jgi:hypothetical protein